MLRGRSSKNSAGGREKSVREEAIVFRGAEGDSGLRETVPMGVCHGGKVGAKAGKRSAAILPVAEPQPNAEVVVRQARRALHQRFAVCPESVFQLLGLLARAREREPSPFESIVNALVNERSAPRVLRHCLLPPVDMVRIQGSEKPVGSRLVSQGERATLGERRDVLTERNGT
eukprot:11668746-Alexandrium_andersonii.AAC.1